MPRVEPGSAAFEASAFLNHGALFIQVGPVLSWQVLISAGSPRTTPTPSAEPGGLAGGHVAFPAGL